MAGKPGNLNGARCVTMVEPVTGRVWEVVHLSTHRVKITAGILGAACALGVLVAPEATAAPASTRCNVNTLGAKLANLDAGAGQRYAQFVVTNTSASTCTLYGHGGFALVGAPTNLTWTANPGPSLVTLAPGKQAAMTLHWTVVPADDETAQPCEPIATAAISIPPDETLPLHTNWSYGPACQHGQLSASAYYAL